MPFSRWLVVSGPASDGKPAAYFDHGTVDVTRLVRGEKGKGIGDFFRARQASQRHALFERFQDFLGYLADDGSRNEAGANRVGAYALASQLARPGLDHPDHAELARR